MNRTIRRSAITFSKSLVTPWQNGLDLRPTRPVEPDPPGRSMVPADILTAKIEYGFDQLTTRSGGVLDGPSHVAMGRRAAAAIGHALGSADEGRMIEAYLNIWRQAHLPHLPAGSRGLTKEEFVRSNLALADDPEAREAILGGLAATFFELADSDTDGRVNREEFWAFQHGHFPELTRAALGPAFRGRRPSLLLP